MLFRSDRIAEPAGHRPLWPALQMKRLPVGRVGVFRIAPHIPTRARPMYGAQQIARWGGGVDLVDHQLLTTPREPATALGGEAVP